MIGYEQISQSDFRDSIRNLIFTDIFVFSQRRLYKDVVEAYRHNIIGMEVYDIAFKEISGAFAREGLDSKCV